MYNFCDFVELYENIERAKDLCRTLSSGVDIQTYYKLSTKLNKLSCRMRRATVGSEAALFEALYNNECHLDDTRWFLEDFYPQVGALLDEIVSLGYNFYDEDYDNESYRQNAWDMFHRLRGLENLVVNI